MNPQHFGRQVASRLLAVRLRTWVILGATLLALMILAAWAAIATLFWALDRAPDALESARPFVLMGIDQLEAVLPGVRDALLALWPGAATPDGTIELPTAEPSPAESR